jgi:hypothetical protein
MTETWADRAVTILASYPQGMTSIEFSARTGINRNRASVILGKLAMYGRIKQVSPYRPRERAPALYMLTERAR